MPRMESTRKGPASTQPRELSFSNMAQPLWDALYMIANYMKVIEQYDNVLKGVV